MKTISSIEIDNKQAAFLKALLRLYKKRLNLEWLYQGAIDVEQLINTGVLDTDDEVLVIDVDSDKGKRAWYIAQAFKADGCLIAFTEYPQNFNAKYTIRKPLSDGSEMIAILNSMVF